MNWLWDRKIAEKEVKKILKDPNNPGFIELAALLLARSNSPKEVLQRYILPIDFCKYWPQIKKRMGKDRWQEPRVIFWQAVYEKVREKLKEKGLLDRREPLVSPDPFLAEIGNQIRAIRKKKDLTQKDLARKLSVSQQLVSRIEKGRQNLSLNYLKRIAETLKEDLKVVLGGAK